MRTFGACDTLNHNSTCDIRRNRLVAAGHIGFSEPWASTSAEVVWSSKTYWARSGLIINSCESLPYIMVQGTMNLLLSLGNTNFPKPVHKHDFDIEESICESKGFVLVDPIAVNVGTKTWIRANSLLMLWKLWCYSLWNYKYSLIQLQDLRHFAIWTEFYSSDEIG